MRKRIRLEELEDWSNEKLIEESELLKDFFTPNGSNWDRLMVLLEIERELTKRESL